MYTLRLKKANNYKITLRLMKMSLNFKKLKIKELKIYIN